MIAKSKPAVGYIRMSSDQQQDSPARQRRDVQALADRMGYEIIKWYEDHGLTGTESSERKDFQKLLSDAKAGSFGAVLLSEQSRMSREDIFDCMQHWRLFRDAGVSIITCQRGELKFDNLGGVITAILDQYGAREESLKLADRVVSGKRLAVTRGQKQGGLPFGYDREVLDESGKLMRRVTCHETFAKPMNWSTRLVISSDHIAVANVSRIESQLADVRAKLERATENLALANREDIPGITKLLAGWREQESTLKDKLRQANGQHAPSSEAMAVMNRLDDLLSRLDEANREKLAFAIRQTVKRITLRRERRQNERHRITLWDGVIELRDDLGVVGVIPLTDDDMPSPGRWRDAVALMRERGEAVYVQEVADALGINKAFTSRLLAQAVLSGKVRNLGHQKGWIATK